jgi:hypothetical protein
MAAKGGLSPGISSIVRGVKLAGCGILLLLIKLAFIGVVILLAYLALREFSADEIAQARSFLPWRVLPATQHQKM